MSPQEAHQRRSRWLLRYVMLVTALACYSRSMTGPFLPLVLKEEFQEPDSVVGYMTAAYPVAAFLITPWAAYQARETVGIVRLHSVAIWLLSASLLLFSTSELVLQAAGSAVATAVMIALRMVQGACFALYTGANTALITRFFPDDVPYVMALSEVALGVGNQFGRILGSACFDAGGFACAFLTVSVLQAVVAAAGFAFPASPSNAVAPKYKVPTQGTQVPTDDAGAKDVPWMELLTPRTWVGMGAVFLMFFQNGFNDATLSPFMMQHLQLHSVTPISVILAYRGLLYIFLVYACAEIMRRKAMSFERLIMIGSGCCVMGFTLIAPRAFILDSEEALLGSPVPLDKSRWVQQIIAHSFGVAGLAFAFAPSLPLMQSEARHLGSRAVEQTAALFMAMMSLGEASGAIVGGWMVQKLGFPAATALLIVPYTALMVAAACVFDPMVLAARNAPSDDVAAKAPKEDVAEASRPLLPRREL